jgi:hypothetical protein
MDLIDLFSKILREAPPKTVKNVKRAFQIYVGEYPDTISYPQFQKIYRLRKSSEQLAAAILDEPKLDFRAKNYDGTQGKGGRRGISKEWQLYWDVENILFAPDFASRRFGVAIPYFDFLRLLTKTDIALGKKELPQVSSEQEELVTWALSRLYDLNKKFFQLIDGNNPNHFRALCLLNDVFDKASFDPIPHKGKSLTKKSLNKAISEVLRYVHSKLVPSRRKRATDENLKRDQRFYREKKFYYVAYLLNHADAVVFNRTRLPFIHELIKRKVIEEIRPYIQLLPANDRQDLVQRLAMSTTK